MDQTSNTDWESSEQFTYRAKREWCARARADQNCINDVGMTMFN